MSEISVGFREGFQKQFLKRDLYPKPLQTLIDLFTKLPGIGPRQATRFVFAILKNKGLAAELSSSLRTLEENISLCSQCFRTMELENQNLVLCSLCRDQKRNFSQIAVVEKESDMQNLEKAGVFNGLYHVLGGVVSPLDSDSPKRLHLKHLYERTKTLLERDGKCEVILATSATTEGDTTALYIDRVLAQLYDKHPQLKITRLGRGLSLGSELEYADEVTLKNALTNRK